MEFTNLKVTQTSIYLRVHIWYNTLNKLFSASDDKALSILLVLKYVFQVCDRNMAVGWIRQPEIIQIFKWTLFTRREHCNYIRAMIRICIRLIYREKGCIHFTKISCYNLKEIYGAVTYFMLWSDEVK